MNLNFLFMKTKIHLFVGMSLLILGISCDKELSVETEKAGVPSSRALPEHYLILEQCLLLQLL